MLFEYKVIEGIFVEILIIDLDYKIEMIEDLIKYMDEEIVVRNGEKGS